MAIVIADRVVAASQACIGVLLDTGDPSLGIEEICERTGLSVRTFHRYFTTRAQMIRPALTDMTTRYDDVVAATAGNLAERAVAAFRTEVVAPTQIDLVGLVAVVRRRRDLWAAYLEAIEFGESHLAEVLAQIDHSLDPLSARVVSAAIVASSRLSLEGAAGGGDPVDLFTRCIHLFGVDSVPQRPDQT